MTILEIKAVLEAASAELVVYDRTGSQHATWARRHGGPLLDSLRAALAEVERLRADVSSAVKAAEASANMRGKARS